MTKKISSYDLWNSWRDFNETGIDQSKGDSSDLNEDAREPESRTLAEKSSSIVAETGQLARKTRKQAYKLPYKDPARREDQEPADARGVERGDLSNIPDTTQELTQLMRYLLNMGVPEDEAQRMVDDVLSLIPTSEGVTSRAILEACGCGSKPTSSIPGEGMMLDYGDQKSDAHEGQYARDQLMLIHYLSGLLGAHLHDEDDLPEWVQIYLVQAEQLVQKVFKHLIPRMDRAQEKEGQEAAHDMSPLNVKVVKQESAPAPMASRANASVERAVKKARKTGKYSTLSLSDMFDVE